MKNGIVYCGCNAALVIFLLSLGLKATLAGSPWKETSELRVAAVQYPIEGNQSVERILAKMERYVKQAIEEESTCVVFPELITLDAWRIDEVESHAIPTPEEAAETLRIATEISPGFLSQATKLAVKYDIDILAGSTPQLREGCIFNTATLIFRDGRQFSQDKLYPTHWERLVGIQPGSELRTVAAPWGTAAILTCYDIEFPDVSSLLTANPPEVIFVPSMTESESGLERVRWCAQARAVEHHAFVVVSGTVGKPSASWEHFGQAAVIAPRDKLFGGQPVVGLRDMPFVLCESLDLNRLRTSRRETVFNPSADRSERAQTAAIKVVPTQDMQRK